jgi:hypothetical protein
LAVYIFFAFLKTRVTLGIIHREVAVKFITIIFTCLSLATVSLNAELIEHHGSPVDSDAQYAECLFCHDGIIAKPISPCLARVCFIKDDHPINKPYPPPGKPLEFASASLAEQAGIRFVSGKIDCISCHNLKNSAVHHLRIDNHENRLCKTCHLR